MAEHRLARGPARGAEHGLDSETAGVELEVRRMEPGPGLGLPDEPQQAERLGAEEGLVGSRLPDLDLEVLGIRIGPDPGLPAEPGPVEAYWAEEDLVGIQLHDLELLGGAAAVAIDSVGVSLVGKGLLDLHLAESGVVLVDLLALELDGLDLAAVDAVELQMPVLETLDSAELHQVPALLEANVGCLDLGVLEAIAIGQAAALSRPALPFYLCLPEAVVTGRQAVPASRTLRPV